MEAHQTIRNEFDELFVLFVFFFFKRNLRFSNITLISLRLITGKTVRFGKISSFIDRTTGNVRWGI